MELEKPKRSRGRPSGRRYPYVRSLRYDDQTAERLRALAEKYSQDESDIIRSAVREKAEKDGMR